MKIPKLGPCAIAVTFVLHASAFADVATLAAAKDNTLFEDTAGGLSDGKGIFFYAGRTASSDKFKIRRGLIAFDLSSIPANATVTAVTLTLTKSNGASSVSLRKVLRDWGEGTSNSGNPGGGGAVAQPGDATWLYNFFSASTWSAAGGDISGTNSATAPTTATIPATVSLSSAGMVADVQSWIANVASNFGWAVLGDEATNGSALRFNSRENTTSPPHLTVTYQAGSTTPTPTPTPTPTATPTPTPFNPANPIPTAITHGPLRANLTPIATGLVSPDLLISAPDGTNRQFVLEQAGQIRLIKNGTLSATPFLDVSGRLVPLTASYDERGLLGLAFDPGFNDATSTGYRRIFTFTSEPVSGTADLPDKYATTLNCHSVLASWRVSAANPDVVDPTSRREILRIDKPQSNHNGGMLAFGPDGYLYLGTGDGGGANDNNANGHNPTIGNGQDVTIALGKILRIDVNGTNSANGKYGIPGDNPFVSNGGGLKEIYAWGLRNPYRFSFNASELLVADVGQNSIEEIDRVQLGKNYGWRYKEGSFKFNPSDGTVSNDLAGVPAGLADPIAQYDHDEGISIIGGFVYRGSLLPELQGKYVFGDFSGSFNTPSGRLFYLDLTSGEIRSLMLGSDDHALGLYVKGMGQDQNGEIYVLTATTLGPTGTSGAVYRLASVPSQLVNIATRLRVETGDNAMIAGFIVTGNASKQVLIRGLGPSLQRFGIANTVADPTLELHASDSSLLRANDNWKDTQQTEIQNTGIPPTDPTEAAIVATLVPGSYTAIENGKNGGTGVGLIEVYDLNSAGGSQLANLSTRGLVQLNDNVMIGGVIIGGGSVNAAATVLVRAIGPTLAQQGVANPLADPTLELRNGNGVLVRANDNWTDDPAQAAAISATGAAPKSNLESALVETLAPGPYTVIVAGKGNTTGVGVVELYRLP
jgi:glucose/arabinose dehydrogenase